MIDGVIGIRTQSWNVNQMRKVWLTRDAKSKVLSVNVLWVGNDSPEVIITDDVDAGHFQTAYQSKTGVYLSLPA